LKAVNVELINLYWEIGRAIAEKQAESWGKSVVPTLSVELQKEFPDAGGFSGSNLWFMAQFYTEYHDVANLEPLVREISWSKHILIIKKCKDNAERQFYIMATRKFGWTKSMLVRQIENWNDTVKMPHEHDSIGIIIYKEKKRTIVEYSLKSSVTPIGVATYTTTKKLLSDYHNLLPDSEALIETVERYFG
jgi:predicted nuclease of restriction endonuclease-like (RecB) superfamily